MYNSSQKTLLTITIRSYKGLGKQRDLRKKQELYIMRDIAGSGTRLFRTAALQSKQTCLPVLALSIFFSQVDEVEPQTSIPRGSLRFPSDHGGVDSAGLRGLL